LPYCKTLNSGYLPIPVLTDSHLLSCTLLHSSYAGTAAAVSFN
jgi:hypothetical protein